MDSYQKFAHDVFYSYGISRHANTLFKHVKPCDMDEVIVNFALMVYGLEYNDNWRCEPINRTKEFFAIADKGCCGSFNTQVKCLSGNMYWIGCNYGH